LEKWQFITAVVVVGGRLWSGLGGLRQSAPESTLVEPMP